MNEPPQRRPPNPECPQCKGAGRVYPNATWYLWGEMWGMKDLCQVPCSCTLPPTPHDPFPDRPDSGDGLPDPDRLNYARSDYR